MGMFDYVSFEEPLPDFPVEVITEGRGCPQTKDIHAYMQEYIVRDRKLYLRHKKYEGTGEFEDKFLGISREKQRLISVRDERIPFHGDIRLACSGKDDAFKYVDLYARFTDGELQWIKTEQEYNDYMKVKL